MSNDETFLRRWSRRKHESAQTGDAGSGPVESTVAPRLPPVEDLSFESDFKDFMRPEVERETRSAALKKLFMSPHYQATDGLDVYVGDYSSPDPLPAAMLAVLAHARGLLADAEPGAPTEPGEPESVAQEGEASPQQAEETASEEQQTNPADRNAGPPDRG
jgi:uncharacterized protein DUF3306